MDAAAQGADFESLHAVMRLPLKHTHTDPDDVLTVRRLLRELVDDGLVVCDGDRYRLAHDLDAEMAEALAYLARLRD